MQKKSFAVGFGLIVRGVAVMLLVLRAALLLAVASLLPPSRTEPAGFQKQRRPAKQRTVKLCLDLSVLMKVSSLSTSTAANMSLSPWTYRDSSVESRIPRQISQAECLTSSCLDPRDGGEMPGLQARPIKYQVLVLQIVPRQNLPTRKRLRQKKYELRLGIEEITVGCTCVMPTVLPQEH